MSIFLQCIISGIAQGAVYSLIALGYNIIYSTMRMGHFAQGDFFMIGAFFGWSALMQLHIPTLPSIGIAVIGTAILMLIVERLVYRPMYTKAGVGLLLSTMGIQYIVQGITKVIWGTEPKMMPAIFGEGNETYNIPFFDSVLKISYTDLMLILICGILMLSLALFMKYTKIGVAMSAVSMNRTAAQLMGIKLTTIIATTYITAAGLAAIAGFLMAPRFSVVFTMGTATGNQAMTSAVMGGFGNMPGAMLGGVLMGIIEQLCAFYLSTAYKDLFIFIVMIIVLFWRPQGILGRKSITKV